MRRRDSVFGFALFFEAEAARAHQPEAPSGFVLVDLGNCIDHRANEVVCLLHVLSFAIAQTSVNKVRRASPPRVHFCG